MTAGLNVQLPPQDDEPSARQAKAIVDQYRSIREYFYGDYYPLTPYSQAADVWLAYQLHLPGKDEGVVVVLKRPASSRTKAVLRLHNLARDAQYEVTFFDTADSKRISGSELTGGGLEIELSKKPDSALVRYRRVP